MASDKVGCFLSFSAVDREFGSNQTIKLVFFASPLSTQH